MSVYPAEEAMSTETGQRVAESRWFSCEEKEKTGLHPARLKIPSNERLPQVSAMGMEQRLS
jgi:hypothetical protein